MYRGTLTKLSIGPLPAAKNWCLPLGAYDLVLSCRKGIATMQAIPTLLAGTMIGFGWYLNVAGDLKRTSKLTKSCLLRSTAQLDDTLNVKEQEQVSLF
jgi:hypothetical protein